MTLIRSIAVVGLFALASWAPLHAQQPAPAPAAPVTPGATPNPPASPAPENAAPAPPPNYIYSAEGRRDPFVPTIGRGFVGPSINPNARPQGIAGLLVDEIVVRGFLESRGAWVAMVGAPNGRNYTLRAGDRVMDGVVRAITSEAVIILQDVNDPLSRVKQREVRKYLRGGEQAQ